MQKSVLLWVLVCSLWVRAEAWAEPPKGRSLKETPASANGKPSNLMLRGKAQQPSAALVANTGLVKDGTPMAVIWSEDPGRALRRCLRVRTLAPLEMLGPKVQEILERVGPITNGKPVKDLESLFVKLPALLQSAGFELSQPATSIVYTKGNKVETLVSFGVDALKLERAFTRWQLPVHLVWFAPELALLMTPPSRPVALIWKGRLYAMAGPDPNSVKMDAVGLGRLLDRVWSKQGDGRGLAASMLSDVSCPEQTDICVKVTLDLLLPERANFPLSEAILPWVKRYFRGIISSFDLRKGIQAEQRFVMAKEFSPVLGILRSDTTLASWFSMLPITTGWFGRTHFSPEGLIRLITFAENFHPKTKEMIRRFRKEQVKADEMAKQLLGTTLTSVLKGLRGDVAGGFLWEDEMARAASVLKNRSMKFFPGHLRGVFFALGFNTSVEAKGFLRLLFQAWSAVLTKRPRRRGGPHVRVEKVSLFGYDALAIHLPGIQPVYLSTVQNFLFFFGHQVTFGQFAAVWKGEAPSFAATDTAGVHTKRALELSGPSLDTGSRTPPKKKTPEPTKLFPQELAEKPQEAQKSKPFASNANKKPELTGSSSIPVKAAVPRTPHALRDSFPGLFDYALVQTANAMVLHPRVLRDLGEWFVPPRFKPFARRVWSHARLLGLYDLVEGTNYAYGWTLAFSEKPLVSDAFLVQRSRLVFAHKRAVMIEQAKREPVLGLKAISKGATGWYNDRHSDQKGNPMPPHFPCEGKGWICAPKAKPCASGTPDYSRNPQVWNDVCWSRLQFGIDKAHLFRYCYKSEGTGLNARYTAKAEADLECNGKLTTYEIHGSVNSTTGELERTNLLQQRGYITSAATIRYLFVPTEPARRDLSVVVAGTFALGLPMLLVSGAAAAVAFQAYLRSVQRAKAKEEMTKRRSKTIEVTTNIAEIAQGAANWYNHKRTKKKGIPTPSQFPCKGKGWICAPQAMPCASGQAQYTPNPAQWNDACWKHLGFRLNKPHYYRYCYKSGGTGANARFHIKAQGDLDCDGKYSTYEIFGGIGGTGNPERSNILLRYPWE